MYQRDEQICRIYPGSERRNLSSILFWTPRQILTTRSFGYPERPKEGCHLKGMIRIPRVPVFNTKIE
eukprot:UN00726